MMGLANWQKLDVFQCSFVNSAADTLEKLHLLLNLSSMTVSFGDDTISIAIPVLEDLKFCWKVLAYVFDALYYDEMCNLHTLTFTTPRPI
jgi:hypothetical protein